MYKFVSFPEIIKTETKIPFRVKMERINDEDHPPSPTASPPSMVPTSYQSSGGNTPNNDDEFRQLFLRQQQRKMRDHSPGTFNYPQCHSGENRRTSSDGGGDMTSSVGDMTSSGAALMAALTAQMNDEGRARVAAAATAALYEKCIRNLQSATNVHHHNNQSSSSNHLDKHQGSI